MSYKQGKDVKKKKAKGGGSDFGMLSVRAGRDNNPNETYADKIAGATMGGRKKAMGGGMMRKTFKKGGGADASKFHTKKDGTKARKGLYYYMNRAKKRGTSKPGKGSVTDKALKASAKTAKKPTKKA